MAAYASPVIPATGFLGGGSYLSCLGENVGVRKADGARMQYAPDIKTSPNIGTSSPERGEEDPFDVMLAGHAASVAARNTELGRSRAGSVNQDNDLLTPITNDGGRVVKRGRRGTATMSSPIQGPLKGRKRGNSHSGLSSAIEPDNYEGIWTQDAGEAGTWTIASTGKPSRAWHAHLG